jgi:hypothetical protein
MPRESNSDSPKTTRLQRAAPGRMRLASMAESWGLNPVAPYLTLAALTVRWLTVRLALDEVWRKTKESNPAGSAPAHGFQDRLATIHRHLPNVKERYGGQGEGRTLMPEGVSF